MYFRQPVDVVEQGGGCVVDERLSQRFVGHSREDLFLGADANVARFERHLCIGHDWNGVIKVRFK